MRILRPSYPRSSRAGSAGSCETYTRLVMRERATSAGHLQLAQFAVSAAQCGRRSTARRVTTRSRSPMRRESTRPASTRAFTSCSRTRPRLPIPRSMDNLRLIINVGTLLHGDCIRLELGHLWDSVTYVPSSRGRSGDHPVRNLARAVSQVANPEAGVERFLLSLGPGYSPGCSHVPRRDRFAVPSEWQSAVRGRHVLVVDDTWTTGASIQSAAAALKLAGAQSVTGLCAARWLKWSWSDHAELLGTCTSDYNALRCMVRKGRCLVGHKP